MKKLLILSRFPSEYEPQRLAEEAGKKEIETEIVNYQKIKIDLGKISLPADLKLKDFDFVIPRSAAHFRQKSLLSIKMALINALPKKIICLNKRTYLLFPKLGKIKQTEILRKKGLPVIPTLKKPNFPAILKAEFGSHSRRVIRVENREEAERVMQSYAGKWIYQPIIKSPFYWRVIVLGEKVLGIMERKTKQRFYKFDSSFGIKKIYGEKKFRQKLEELAIKAAKIFKAEFAGVDLLADENKPMIIEVNRSPQFQVFETMTNINVAENIIDYLTSLLK